MNTLKNKIEILAVKPGDSKRLKEVASMLEEMYREMLEMGLMTGLAEKGAEKWISGMESTLGKLSYLLVAVREDKIIGFAHGSLRFMPEYLGGELTGNITHIYLERDFRSMGIGEDLLEKLEEWFRHKKVASIDLEVLPANEKAKNFWLGKGYDTELIKFRKIV